MKKIAIVFVFLFLSFFCAPSAMAQVRIEAQSVNPGESVYVLKRVKEKIFLMALGLFPHQKADYYMKLVGIRLSELKHVVDGKEIANIEETSQRYEAAAGEMTEYILNKGLTDYKQKAVDLMSSQIPVIEKLRDIYQPTRAEWRFVQNDINSLKLYTTRFSSVK